MSGRRRSRRQVRARQMPALPRRLPAPAAELKPSPPPPAAEPPLPAEPLPAELTYPRQLTADELTGGKDDTTLTAELAAKLRKLPTCSHCGGRHSRACPRVKRMQFHPNGALAEVEFWAAGRWPEADIIWPEDIAEAEEPR